MECPPPGMKRLSIYHQLPYWGELQISHLLDPMHIFKNVGDSIWAHLVGDKDMWGELEDLKELDRMSDI